MRGENTIEDGGRVMRLCRPSRVISPSEISTQESEGDEVHRAEKERVNR